MDPNQLPPGMFTPERPSGSNANDPNNTASLLSSPFLLFANALSPITPSRALLAQGVSDAQAAALTALPARSPAPLCFSSPSNQKSAAGKSTGDRKRSNLSKANASEQPSGLEEVAMSADAAVLAAVNALAQSPLRPGVLDDVQDVASVAALRKQLESEFNVHLTEPESNVVRSISKLEKELLSLDDELALDDSLLPRHVLRSPGHQTTRPAGRVRGAAARLGAPAGVGAVADMAAAEAGADANKRSSTTGASMEWPHGLCKTIKKDGEDSPRMGSATARGKARGSTASSRGSVAKGKKGAAAAAALLEEEMHLGRPNSAPVGRGGRAESQSGRRLSVTAAATPAAKGERAPRPSLDSLRDDGSPRQSASKKCNCKKSKCLKLYCECFAAGVFCDMCSCQNCQNTPDNANLVAMTRQQIELRNPQAFADKIVATDGTGEDARHKRGCHCKKSACLKKYCECFQAGVLCQDYCKCEGCKNKGEDSPNFGKDREAKAPTAKDTPRRVAAATAAAVAAVEEAAMNFMASEDEHDLIIEDLIDIKSPGRSGAAVLAAADGLGLDLLQSPPKVSPGGGGFGSAGPMATPMKRAEMSPLTPGSRTILRAGPGRTTLTGGAAANTRSKVPPPRFDQAKDVAANDVTPKITRSARNRARGFGSLPGSHDALAGGMIATLGSPVPLSTPEGFE